MRKRQGKRKREIWKYWEFMCERMFAGKVKLPAENEATLIRTLFRENK